MVKFNRNQRDSDETGDDPAADERAFEVEAETDGLGVPVLPSTGSRSSGDTVIETRPLRPRPSPADGGEGRTRPREFLREVNVELRKVVWPSRSETINYSSVVLVTLAVLMAVIFGLDYVFADLSRYLFTK